ncbi:MULTISPECIES: formate hydrogenlyase maturation HycH family protein [unclassified Lebetimonas]|jgi:hypothetical protein|uniref:formate hydrogenlyase maturation HycH family protein n=1 Tax=unclassified Lebetimonas TaxID=2648158 RepID=UPI0004677F1A|nr:MULTISPECIES: formate hydrogenlyase maturation HycH family protein [unclassified Lebetimonas]
MIEVNRLTKRHVDKPKKMPRELEQIKIFSTLTGHGVGTIDFVECVMKLEDEEFNNILENSKDYAKFKLGNLLKYREIEIFPEHIEKLKDSMAECELKNLFLSLKEGYFVLRLK